jgi:amidase
LNAELHARKRQAYFDQVDVFPSSVAFTAAFAHDQIEPRDQRTSATSAGPRHYMDMLNWIAAPTLTGCPATVAPVGRTPDGLPVGIQIMGPFWEDATPITFADLLAKEVGGFVPPSAYKEQRVFNGRFWPFRLLLGQKQLSLSA